MPNQTIAVPALESVPVPDAEKQTRTSPQRLPVLQLAVLTLAAVGIHGYHLGVEDGEIYLPAARKLLDPSLYPFATEFFLSHGRLSLFSPILAWTARLTHLSMDWTVFVWYIATTFFLLVACWQLAKSCFNSQSARWGAVLLISCVLTMPATNTGLLLMDPYLTARSFSTPLTLFALNAFLRGRYALGWLAVFATASFHPQMTAYLILLIAILLLSDRFDLSARPPIRPLSLLVGLWPFDFHLEPATGAFREALYSRDFYFLANWTWYHWVGMIAPLLLLLWFGSRPPRGTTPAFRRLALVLIPFGLLSIFVASVFASSHSFDSLARLQPLRCFHLIYLVFFLMLGSICGEYTTRSRSALRITAATASILLLAGGMLFVNAQTYPESAHIDWPWLRTSSNAWMNTLLWVRYNTPKDAVFAVDSRYFKDRGVDERGFRAISERSALADYFKDGGVATIFPKLTSEWKQMSDATYGLNHFTVEDFARLAQRYPVTWAVIHGPAPKAMNCPYQQRGYAVCRI